VICRWNTDDRLARQLRDQGVNIVMPTMGAGQIKVGSLASELRSDRGRHLGFTEASWKAAFGFEPETRSFEDPKPYSEHTEISGELNSKVAAKILAQAAGLSEALPVQEVEAAMKALKASGLSIRFVGVVQQRLENQADLLRELNEKLAPNQSWAENGLYLVKRVFLAKGISVSFNGRGNLDADFAVKSVQGLAASIGLGATVSQIGEYTMDSPTPRIYGVELFKIEHDGGGISLSGNTKKGSYRDIEDNPYLVERDDNDDLFVQYLVE